MNTTTCHNCGTQESYTWHGIFIEKKYTELCNNCYIGNKPDTINLANIDKLGSRALHWRDIQTRVKTHEGEFLSGRAGVEYQKKWSEQCLGRNLVQSPSIDRRTVEQFIHSKKT